MSNPKILFGCRLHRLIFDSREASLMKQISLTPRLNAALEMLTDNGSVRFDVAADVGCDHGKLSIALLQSGAAARVIASDISISSLEKARILAQSFGLEDRLCCIVSDGFSAYSGMSVDCAVLLGMGGELIANILESDGVFSHKLKRLVMQPMRGEAELREYLYAHDYRIISERIVFDAGRFYQLISAEPGNADPLPHGWPVGYYQFGAAAYESGEALLKPMVERYLGIMRKKLSKSPDDPPAALLCEIGSCERILELISSKEETRL